MYHLCFGGTLLLDLDNIFHHIISLHFNNIFHHMISLNFGKLLSFCFINKFQPFFDSLYCVLVSHLRKMSLLWPKYIFFYITFLLYCMTYYCFFIMLDIFLLMKFFIFCTFSEFYISWRSGRNLLLRINNLFYSIILQLDWMF